MTRRNEPRASLSKNLLQMKFMQRTVLRNEVQQNAEENKHKIDDEHWVLDIPDLKRKQSNIHFESSYSIIEKLKYGRQSFKGFNPEVEKLMAINNGEIPQEEPEEQETTVNDEEMAERYQSLVGTVAKKFMKKRDRSQVEDSTKSQTVKEEASTKSQTVKEEASTSGETPKKKKKRTFMKPQD